MSANHIMEKVNVLAPLQVIDHLKVGPVSLSPNRLSMPYTVVQNGVTHSNELVYKYEEPVFDPDQPASQQLASVIGAQLALNYGLFCRKLTFDGLFSTADQRFLLDMLENTSREIMVMKFYRPNPFLLPTVNNLPVQQQKRYTQAKVEFINTRFEQSVLPQEEWGTDHNKCCVLSSGGKDSLLSYAMLKEIGMEVHPIFGNESGRHWFTALNGYRHLKATDTNTGRVWMNSDRLFAWMLRHLPFVRKDFASLRADDYPIRLWTVAVFLFGVLPLMKKRGLGYLVIGNEYDSTQRGNHEGITHYNGLYDQSRYFDEAMSRYFQKNGWNMRQFSVLRPMSELLIMKTLVKRYPDLQKHQVSCHAAHEKEGRIHPCGKCEKCRRIVGMLTALDADPGNCGYTKEQIGMALNSLATNKVKQLGADASHLFFLLAQKEIIPAKAKARAEVMHLRFDQQRSQLRDIPENIRELLFRLILPYSEGILVREKHEWLPFDPFNLHQ